MLSNFQAPCDQDAAKKAATKTANLNSQLQAPGAGSRRPIVPCVNFTVKETDVKSCEV